MTQGIANPKESANQSEQRIDAIKQLIFGENMVEYDSRFEEVMRQMSETQKALEGKIKDLNKALTSKMNELEKVQNKRMDATDKKNESAFAKMDDKKTDRLALGKMLEKIGKDLQA